MKTKFYSFIVCIFLSICSLHDLEAKTIHERMAKFKIVPYKPSLKDYGCHNSDMKTNGEVMMMDLIQPGDIVFDVGAYVGEWSLNLLEKQPDVSLHCFEPIPTSFLSLKNNLKSKPATVNKLAVNNTDGKVTFYYYLKHPYLSTLHRRMEVEKHLEMKPVIFDVTSERLDTYCERMNISHINYLKADPSGNEYHVILGAEKLLQKNAIDFIQFEYGGTFQDAHVTLKEVYYYLLQYGFELHRITRIGLIKIGEWNDDLETFNHSNYLAIRKETTS